MSLVMAFDFGMKKIGIAVGQEITGTANPLTIIKAVDGIPDWQQIEKLLAEWKPNHLVVGLPLNMDDTESELSYLATKFARRLTGRFNLPHTMVDERLSSFEAAEYVEEGQMADAIAAKLILETYFSER